MLKTVLTETAAVLHQMKCECSCHVISRPPCSALSQKDSSVSAYVLLVQAQSLTEKPRRGKTEVKLNLADQS